MTTEEKENYEIDKLISKVFKENVEGMLDNIFESKTCLISMYLLKYIYDRDDKAFNLFVEGFKNLNYMEQIQVLVNVSENLKLKKHKQKVKKHHG